MLMPKIKEFRHTTYKVSKVRIFRARQVEGVRFKIPLFCRWSKGALLATTPLFSRATLNILVHEQPDLGPDENVEADEALAGGGGCTTWLSRNDCSSSKTSGLEGLLGLTPYGMRKSGSRPAAFSCWCLKGMSNPFAIHSDRRRWAFHSRTTQSTSIVKPMAVKLFSMLPSFTSRHSAPHNSPTIQSPLPLI